MMVVGGGESRHTLANLLQLRLDAKLVVFIAPDTEIAVLVPRLAPTVVALCIDKLKRNLWCVRVRVCVCMVGSGWWVGECGKISHTFPLTSAIFLQYTVLYGYTESRGREQQSTVGNKKKFKFAAVISTELYALNEPRLTSALVLSAQERSGESAVALLVVLHAMFAENKQKIGFSVLWYFS